MRNQDSYWARRLARRRVLGGAATAGIGAASLALVGCGDDDDGSESPTTSTGDSTTAPGGSTTPSSSPAAQQQKGGIARFTSANNTYDTFDADRTRFGPMATLLGLTNLGVVCWDRYDESKIVGHFAESWEQPDDTTYTFKVRPNLFWHNKPPVNGRAANAEDIKLHIERNKAGTLKDGTKDANFYRNALFEVVDSVEVVDEQTVTVKMTKPWPFFLNTLAGTWTKVQAPEAVDQFESDYSKFSADLIIGTGDWVLTDFKSEGSLSFRPHDKPWRTPWWDGIDFVPLFTDQAAQQAAFEQKQVDSFAPAQAAVLEDLKKRLQGQVHEKNVFALNPVAGSYYGGTPPWNDERLIGAIFQVLDRRGLIQQLLQGRGAMSANTPPAWAPYTLTENELITFPGYLEDRDKDIADAKAKWEAAGGAQLGEITVDFPDIFEGSYAGVSAIVTNHLKGIFGNEFRAKLEPYATITSKIVAQQYGNGNNSIWFGWVTPPDDPDPSISFINGFNSKNAYYHQFDVPVPGMDELTEKMAVEFDTKKRIELCKEANRLALRAWGAGRLPLYLQIVNTLYWNYFVNSGETTHFVTSHNWSRDLSFNMADPTWQGRKA